MQRASKRQREEFVGLIVREFPALGVLEAVGIARELMRAGATHGRLAEARCNGAWPAGNGERWASQNCPVCDGEWATESMRKDREAARVPDPTTGKPVWVPVICPSCRCQRRIAALCGTLPGAVPVFGGDPRGCTVKIKLPSGVTNDWARDGVCVPTA